MRLADIRSYPKINIAPGESDRDKKSNASFPLTEFLRLNSRNFGAAAGAILRRQATNGPPRAPLSPQDIMKFILQNGLVYYERMKRASLTERYAAASFRFKFTVYNHRFWLPA